MVAPTSDIDRQHGPLRTLLEATALAHGLPLARLTVLAAQRDPFRLDTPANHRDGAWLANTAADLGLGGRTIHLRGMHYMLIGATKPNGEPYANTAADWEWLSESAGKAARWLGYLDWDQVIDQRNAEPLVQLSTETDPRPVIDLGFTVYLPDPDDVEPRVRLADFTVRQPHRVVMIGEKSSLGPILSPLAGEYEVDLYLPTGEPSDTMLHRLARDAAEDGRPLRVLYFSDCDPSGWQMPVSVARKLQAFTAALYPDLQFQVHRVALTPDQVREYGLPSTPLKSTELRGDRWQAAQGVAQTEIDALAALQPDLLETIARDALDWFHDHTLPGRVAQARYRWEAEAQDALAELIGEAELAAFRAQAAEKLSEAHQLVAELSNALQVDAGELDLPSLEVPEAIAPPNAPAPLISSSWPFADQCAALTMAKSYGAPA